MNAIQPLADRISAWTGLDLGRRGAALDQAVRERVAELGETSIDAFVARCSGPESLEVLRLVNALTVPFTWFHRDPDQLRAVAEIITRHPAGSLIQAWVPGCATGEDAYTLAMLAAAAGRPIEVLGTDINSDVLRHARTARYGQLALRELPAALSVHVARAGEGQVEVSGPIRAAVRFEAHNLVDAPPIPHTGSGWDLILCRNVLIHFAHDRVAAVLRQLGRSLHRDGWLFLGANEVQLSAPEGLAATPVGGRLGFRRVEVQRAAALPPRPAPAAPPPRSTEAGSRALLAWAAEMLDAGRLIEAIDGCSRLLEQDPLDAEARLLAGIAYHLGGDHAAAMPLLRSALCLVPHLWPAAFYLATCHERLGQTREAERVLARLLETKDTSVPLGLKSHFMGDFEQLKQEVMWIVEKRKGTNDHGARR